MARPRQIRITREGFYYSLVLAAVLIGATSRQLNLLVLIGCVLLGPMILSLVYGRWAMGKIAVQRRLPTSLHAGERLRNAYFAIPTICCCALPMSRLPRHRRTSLRR